MALNYEGYDFTLGPYRSLCKICHLLVSKIARSDSQDIAESLPTTVQQWLQIEGAFPNEANCFICSTMSIVRVRTRHTPSAQEQATSKVPASELAIRSDNWELNSLTPMNKGRAFSLTAWPRSQSNDFYLERADDVVYEKARQARFSSSTGSTESLDLASQWLGNCLRQHKNCRNRANPDWYPTYLLDVMNPKPRLINTREQKPQAPYMTMSHCWGKERFFVLTTENIGDFLSGTPLSCFPPSFQDAIAIARHLQIRYLWIDSYCIVQDSESGGHLTQKLIEIAQMRDVYANSSLNLGVSHAKGPAVGCFVARTQPVQRSSDAEDMSNDPGVYQTQLHLYSRDDSSKLEGELEAQNLLQRGWVLQERLLSSRMLFFTEKQLYWQCQELSSSEALPSGVFDRSIVPSIGTILRQQRPHEFPSVWCSIVEQYSATQLTYPSQDKLVAIGGLARYVAEEMKQGYVAGLMDQDLVAQLCWRARTSGRAREWRAPSWSWASSDSQVSWDQDFVHSVRTEIVRIKEIHTNLSDPRNPYGPLESCSMLLRARLLKAAWEQHPKRNLLSSWSRSDDPDRVYMQEWSDDDSGMFAWCGGFNPKSVLDPEVHRMLGEEVPVLPHTLDPATLRQESLDAEFYLLPLCMQWAHGCEALRVADIVAERVSAPLHTKMVGLIVKKISTTEYFRHGLFTITNGIIVQDARCMEAALKAWSVQPWETITLI